MALTSVTSANFMEAILASAENAKESRSGFISFRCPVHQGKSETSAWATIFPDGGPVAKCHACQSGTKRILEELGLKLSGDRKHMSDKQLTREERWQIDSDPEKLMGGEEAREMLCADTDAAIWRFCSASQWCSDWPLNMRDGFRRRIAEYQGCISNETGEPAPEMLDGVIGVLKEGGYLQSAPPVRTGLPDSPIAVYPLRYPRWNSLSISWKMMWWSENGREKRNLAGKPYPPFAVFSPRQNGRQPHPDLKGKVFLTEGEGDAVRASAAGAICLSAGSASNMEYAVWTISQAGAKMDELVIICDSDTAGLWANRGKIDKYFASVKIKICNGIGKPEAPASYESDIQSDTIVKDVRDYMRESKIEALTERLCEIAHS